MHINSLQCYRECFVTCAILKDPHQHKTCQATTELLLQCPPSTIFHTIIYSTLWALQLSRFPRSAFPVPEFPHSGPTTECAWILSFWIISQDLRQNSTPTIVKHMCSNKICQKCYSKQKGYEIKNPVTAEKSLKIVKIGKLKVDFAS